MNPFSLVHHTHLWPTFFHPTPASKGMFGGCCPLTCLKRDARLQNVSARPQRMLGPTAETRASHPPAPTQEAIAESEGPLIAQLVVKAQAAGTRKTRARASAGGPAARARASARRGGARAAKLPEAGFARKAAIGGQPEDKLGHLWALPLLPLPRALLLPLHRHCAFHRYVVVVK